jgi:hypothetical protein
MIADVTAGWWTTKPIASSINDIPASAASLPSASLRAEISPGADELDLARRRMSGQAEGEARSG